MIRQLRQRHGLLAAAMLVGGLAGIATAVLARPASTVQLAMPTDAGTGRTIRVEGLAVELRIAPDSSRGHRVWVRSTAPTRIPDPLLYYVAATPTDSSALPSNAIFLGSVVAEFRRPILIDSTEAVSPGGALVLWSNGYRRIVAVASFDFVAALPR